MKTPLFLLTLFFLCSAFVLTPPPSPSGSGAGASDEPQAGEITILFAYTTKAAMEVGGPKEIKKNVDNGLRLLNEALENSRIGYKAVAVPQFVHIKDLSTQDANTSDLIGEFNKPDGKYNQVHQYRKQLKADLLCLIFEGGRTSKGMLNGEVMVVTAKGAWGGSYI
ncbi:MAG: hypothetical protein D6765_10835, partial [Bacteroidetes bacterium]